MKSPTGPHPRLSADERAAAYVRRMPPAISGQGGHDATFRAACTLLHGFALEADAALAILREWNAGCQPPWTEHELVHKIRSALVHADRGHPRGYLLRDGAAPAPAGLWTPGPVTPRRKAEFAPEKLASIAAKLDGIDAEWLAARSPVAPDNRTPASFLHALYRPGEKVIVFDDCRSQGEAVWTHREPPFDARELDAFRTGAPNGVWFLSNPVSGEFAINDDGQRSRRSWQTVTSWRYVVIESDEADGQHWLAALAQLPLAIAAIYTSAAALDAPSMELTAGEQFS